MRGLSKDHESLPRGISDAGYLGPGGAQARRDDNWKAVPCSCAIAPRLRRRARRPGIEVGAAIVPVAFGVLLLLRYMQTERMFEM